MGETFLPPGFRFHPTDEELIYFLRRKVKGLDSVVDLIPVIELYNFEPWELPEKYLCPDSITGWFFFVPCDREYPNGSPTNRATRAGYWKATGKDRKFMGQSSVEVCRKTLVYYRGRAPFGIQTDWVMHEYRLFDDVSCGIPSFQGPFALCRVMKKNESITSYATSEPKTKAVGDKLELHIIDDSPDSDAENLTDGDTENSTDREIISFKSFQGKKPSAIPSDAKWKTAPKDLSQEVIEQQFGKTMKEAAKNLNVSLSTLKRKYKKYGYSEWQGPNIVKRMVNASSNNQSKRNEEDNGAIQEPSVVNRNKSIFTIKAEYAEDIIKFDLHTSQASFVSVQKEIGNKFNLTPGTYKLKYLDKDDDLILLTSDQDMGDCIEFFRNLGQTVVRLCVLPSP